MVQIPPVPPSESLVDPSDCGAFSLCWTRHWWGLPALCPSAVIARRTGAHVGNQIGAEVHLEVIGRWWFRPVGCRAIQVEHGHGRDVVPQRQVSPTSSKQKLR